MPNKLIHYSKPVGKINTAGMDICALIMHLSQAKNRPAIDILAKREYTIRSVWFVDKFIEKVRWERGIVFKALIKKGIVNFNPPLPANT